MKQIFRQAQYIVILFFILSVSILAQTVDSVGVNWTDPLESDLDSMLVKIRKVYNPTDTPIVARVNEGIETARFVPADTGLYFVAPIGKDTASNVAIPIFTFAALDSGWVDTVTAFQTAGGSYTAGAIYIWDDDDAGMGLVINLYDQVDSFLVTTVEGREVTKTDSGLVSVEGDEYLRANPPVGGILDSMVTIEFVGKLVDITSQQVFFGIRNSGDATLGLGVYNGNLIGTFYKIEHGMSVNETYNCDANLALGWHHIVMTWNGGTTYTLIIDGVTVADAGNSDEYGGLIEQARVVMWGGNGGNTWLPTAGNIVRRVTVYDFILTEEQALSNFNSATIQDKIPAWAK